MGGQREPATGLEVLARALVDRPRSPASKEGPAGPHDGGPGSAGFGARWAPRPRPARLLQPTQGGSGEVWSRSQAALAPERLLGLGLWKAA